MSACKICLELEPVEDLCSPCDCKGSAGLVHRSCLNEWRASADNREAANKCMDCNAEYQFDETIEKRVLPLLCYYCNCLLWPLVYSIGYFWVLNYCYQYEFLSAESLFIMYLLPVNFIIVNLYGKKTIFLCLLLDTLLYLGFIVTGVIELMIPVINIILWIIWRMQLNLPEPKIYRELINQRQLEISKIDCHETANETVNTPLLTTSLVEIQPVGDNLV